MTRKHTILAPVLTVLTLTFSFGCGTQDDPSGASDPTTSEGEASTSANVDSGAVDEESSATTEMTQSGDETSETGTFVSETDEGGDCGDQCDIWAENDCMDDEKCTAVACEVGSSSWDSNVCRPVGGEKSVGDECDNMGSGIDGNDDCADGSMCWGTDPDTGFGICVAFCTGSPDAGACDGGGGETLCSIYNNGVLPLCLPKCDPLVQECASGDICIPHPSGEGFNCVIDSSNDMGPYGTPCEFANSCNAGLLCIEAAGVPEAECAGASGCCSPVCDLGAGEECPGQGQMCEQFYEDGAVPPGYESVGICTIPV